jgi:hypothetical protein
MTTESIERELRAFPSLTRFYGIGPEELARIPLNILRIYADEMPRIQAREQLLAMQVAAYPYLKPASQREAWRRLQRRAREHKVEAALIPQEKLKETLAGIGIGFYTNEPKAEGSGD